jgi:hypothetical protein
MTRRWRRSAPHRGASPAASTDGAVTDGADVTSDEKPLSDSDKELAQKAVDYCGVLSRFALLLAAGHGDVEQKTAAGQPLGTIREFVAEVVAQIESSPLMEDKQQAFGDEKAALLRPDLHYLFATVKKLRTREAEREQIEAAFMRDLADAADEIQIVLDDDAATRVRQGPLAALLEGQMPPVEAAILSTTIILQRRYEVQHDAAKEGALKRVRERSGNPHFGMRLRLDDAPPLGALDTLLQQLNGK